MHLASLFRDNLILLGARIDSKETAIRILIERIAETHHGLDAEHLYQKVMEREAMTSTAFPNGVAIPHARIEHFEDLVIAVLVPADKVDSIRIMFLILTDL
ncbi:MAG: PTS sugar transporter subunit IIA, partial [Candidatus Latescibacterota bacterium]